MIDDADDHEGCFSQYFPAKKAQFFLLAGAIAFGMLVITMLNALTGGVVGNLRVNFSHALGGPCFYCGTGVYQ